MNITVFWDVKSCSLVDICRRKGRNSDQFRILYTCKITTATG